MPNELKPCPFCGGEAKFIVKKAIEGNIFAGFDFVIQCSKCKVEYPKTFRISLTLTAEGDVKEVLGAEGAIKFATDIWNRRADNA